MDSFVSLAYASLGTSGTLLQGLPACLLFIFRRFVLSVQMQKWWLRLNLMRDIYINSNMHPLTKFPRSSRSTEFKDIFSWNISQMITKTAPTSTKIVISSEMKWGILFWVWQKVNGNWDNSMIIVKQILGSEEVNKFKWPGPWKLQSEIQLGMLTTWVTSFQIWDYLNYSRVHQFFQFHQNRLGSPYDGC